MTECENKFDERRNRGNHALIIFLMILALCSARYAQAAGPACNDLGAGVIFKDSMYGMLLGVVGTGLYIYATDTGDKADRKLAVGGLVGLGVGGIIGLTETAMRDCDDRALLPKRKPGWQKPELFAQRGRVLSYEPPSSSPESVGLEMGFRF